MGSDSCNTKSNIMYTSSQPKSTVKIKHKVPWQTDDDDSDVEYNPALTRSDIYRPLLPIRKTSSRQMCRRNRRKIGKTNLNPDYRVNMMTGVCPSFLNATRQALVQLTLAFTRNRKITPNPWNHCDIELNLTKIPLFWWKMSGIKMKTIDLQITATKFFRIK